MSSAVKPLQGVYAASLTPLKPDGRPDLGALVAHCRWLMANGCDGVAPLGTTGEANSLALDDRLEVIAACGAGLPADRLLIGTGASAVGDAAKLTRAALAAGTSHVLALPPFYYKGPSEDGLFAFYSSLIETVGDSRLKVYLYHIPPQSAVPITHGLINRLIKRYPTTVVGLKDSSGDWQHTEGLCKAFPGFATFAGTEELLLPTLQAGGAGCISATANVTCRLAREVFDVAKAGGDAGPKQAAMTKVRLAFQAYPLIAGLKAMMARATGDQGWNRLAPPNMPLSPAQAEALAARLAELAFTIPDYPRLSSAAE